VASLKGKNILSTKDLSHEEVEELFEISDFYENLLNKKKQLHDLQGKLLTPLFFEPSTRTSCSFQAAITRLGGSTVQSELFFSLINIMIPNKTIRDNENS
jgi:aspartate carbamoyltransferase catalytic subunit